MIDFSAILRQLDGNGLGNWADTLGPRLRTLMSEGLHGDFPHWIDSVSRLPSLPGDVVVLNSDRISVSAREAIDSGQLRETEHLLRSLHPWRKGPYDIHGLVIDTEWRSDWKWRRLAPHISDLNDRRVLDIGCGNGYHCWRMAGAGAGLVVGLDPTQLFLAQFLAVRHFLGERYPVHLLPLGIEDLPPNLQAFDSVFSMGVLYHRRSPIDHLLVLRGCLRSGGELVIETLVVTGGREHALVPAGRYAKMRNVWFIPSPEALAGWMERCGFRDVRVVDVSPTTTEEQRSTDWMRFESLTDFLDPRDPSLTVEGYPAPVRAVLVATAG